MRGRPFAIMWGPDDTEAALKAAYLAERDGPIRSRLHALRLLRSGRSLRETTSAVGVHYRTVQRWVDWYRRGGIALVRTRRMGGVGHSPLSPRDAQEQVAFANKKVMRPRFLLAPPRKVRVGSRRSPHAE